MFAKYIAGKAGIMALIALLTVLGSSYAQPGASQQGWPINHPSSSGSFPWNSPGYQGYNEPSYALQPIYGAAPMAQPEKYEVYVNALAMENTVDPNAVTLVAHVPENAQVWVEDDATTSRGALRTYQSPPLTPGKSYSYTVRVAWMENGKVVSQTRHVPVKAGDVECVYLDQRRLQDSGGKECCTGERIQAQPGGPEAGWGAAILCRPKRRAARRHGYVGQDHGKESAGIPVLQGVRGARPEQP